VPTATLQFRSLKQLGEDRVVSGDCGAVKKQLNKTEETKKLPETFSPGSNWGEVRKEFTVKFDNKDLNTLEKTTGAELLLSPGTGQISLNDFQLVEKQ
jgi:hypothetical protein